MIKDRLGELRKYYSHPKHRILELGPFANPIFPKSEGFNVKIVDAFSRDELLSIARSERRDPGFASELTLSTQEVARIEEVDFIWKGNLADSVKLTSSDKPEFDLICSSHNFEHQPNPLLFLADVEDLLSEHGVCTMAIPISTRCFDLLRTPSSTRDFLEKFYSKKRRPELPDYLDATLSAVTSETNMLHKHKKLSQSDLKPVLSPDDFNEMLCNRAKTLCAERYIDTHVSVLNAKAFVLILVDLWKLGYLKRLKVFDVSEGRAEFFVHLSKSRDPIPAYSKSRKDLCVEAADYWATEIKNALAPRRFGFKKLLKPIGSKD